MWTDAENKRFEEALSLFGRDWGKCAEHMGTRNRKWVAGFASLQPVPCRQQNKLHAAYAAHAHAHVHAHRAHSCCPKPACMP